MSAQNPHQLVVNDEAWKPGPRATLVRCSDQWGCHRPADPCDPVWTNLVTEGVEVFGVVNNLFDKDPPLAASAQGGTNQVYFDPLGRYIRAGVRVRF